MTPSPCTQSSHLLLLILLLLDRHRLHLMLFHKRRSWRNHRDGIHAISLVVFINGEACFESSQSTYIVIGGSGDLPSITNVMIKRTHSKAPIPADALAQSIAVFQFAGRAESIVCTLPEAST